MKKTLHILLAALVLAGLAATAQIKRGSKNLDTKPKTEKSKKQASPKANQGQAKKQHGTTAKSNETSKSPNQSSTRSNANNSSSQTNEASTQLAEPIAYDVNFSCNVSEATIYIDGNDYGKSNGTRILKTGDHQVKLVAEGYEDYTTTINVASGNTSFDFKMRAILKETYVAKVETFTVKGVSFEMVYVDGGTFIMGAADDDTHANDRAKPAHQVTLDSYFIGKTVVTQALWKVVMGKNPSEFNNNLQNPVEKVSWKDCQKFIKKLNELTGKNFRLPTEAEWEYAARGGKWSNGYKYFGSNQLDAVAWYKSNSEGMTHPVGQKSPNELGLYDMNGNVMEWCQDWFGIYSSEPQTNPQGPSSGSERVYRGGSWLNHDIYFGVSRRAYSSSSTKSNYIGFRLAL